MVKHGKKINWILSGQGFHLSEAITKEKGVSCYLGRNFNLET